jgi:excinuclease ABC subunit C
MTSDSKPDFFAILSSLPEDPGCYMYLNESGVIIYVGKAKNLKRRVSSYFNKTCDNLKTQLMLRKIHDIRYLVVKSEEEALLLENSLIKEHQPKYNILLKDDKTYPWLVVKNEPFPRVFLTRKKINDKSHYYGPFPHVTHVKYLLALISNLYPIRICKHNLAKENIEKGKFNLCLQYHIKKCLAPCVGLQTEEDYNKNIETIEEILKGNLNEVSKHLYDQMIEFSQNLLFEEAELMKERYNTVKNYSSKSVVVSQEEFHNIDVFSYDDNSQSAYINYLHIANGSIVQGYTIEYKKCLDESKESILGMGIVELRSRFESKADQIIVPFFPDIDLNAVEFIIPRRGDKKKLLDLSKKNVQQFKIDRLKQSEKLNPDQRYTRILKTLQNDLHLKSLPLHIECFDNSNIQGTNPVSACVVFKMAHPSKKDYRHYNIKTVVGPDDFSSMYETVSRRYLRLVEDGDSLPQLIVVDGGKGQLHAATDALNDLGLYGQIAIIGIAKRLEEIYFPNDPIPLYLDKDSESLKLIQQLRDEAHRFGITFHRNKRSKQQIVSELDAIKGIGPVVKETLLKKYKSMKRIKEASKEEITDLIGKVRAEHLFKGLDI